MPKIGAGLGSNVAGLQWVVDGYSLALAALLLAGGTVGDRHGHRPVVLTGMAVFGATSLGRGRQCRSAGRPTAGRIVGARAGLAVGVLPQRPDRARRRRRRHPHCPRRLRPRRWTVGPRRGRAGRRDPRGDDVRRHPGRTLGSRRRRTGRRRRRGARARRLRAGRTHGGRSDTATVPAVDRAGAPCRSGDRADRREAGDAGRSTARGRWGRAAGCRISHRWTARNRGIPDAPARDSRR
ncbi:MAG: hypothetical protein ACRD0H_16610 [Actinomycetes bacterium]